MKNKIIKLTLCAFFIFFTTTSCNVFDFQENNNCKNIKDIKNNTDLVSREDVLRRFTLWNTINTLLNINGE